MNFGLKEESNKKVIVKHFLVTDLVFADVTTAYGFNKGSGDVSQGTARGSKVYGISGLLDQGQDTGVWYMSHHSLFFRVAWTLLS